MRRRYATPWGGATMETALDRLRLRIFESRLKVYAAWVFTRQAALRRLQEPLAAAQPGSAQ